ncbi:hypothetical protein FCH28_12025 [Streptomyces piniterrae]|uniref:Cell wall protein n=1 Tax=Streptomyces piniterrae TaxID=2571125 RepID=A0A4V5ML63_9ACTN|nr:hypothetical protein [Streptomyces piniterrae]TJZ55988.1 hypothetical protein FCH28_12025 [Streptomyces piniterrae]
MNSSGARLRTARGARTVRAACAVFAVGLLSGLVGGGLTVGRAYASTVRAPGPAAACGRPDSPEFPIASRVSGGPAVYSAGGDWQTWRLELRNTTTAACEDVHPVVVLTDTQRVLRPARIRLEFRDTAGGWRPVPFEATDLDEQIGVFGKGDEKGEEKRGGVGRGLTVPGKGTLTVPVRMRFEPGTSAERITANVTTVQRRGSDGEWIGQSGDYRFAVRPSASAPATPMTPMTPMTPATPGRPPQPGTSPGGPQRPPRAPAESPELAATGHGSLFGIGVMVAGLLAGGVVLVAAARGLRR